VAIDQLEAQGSEGHSWLLVKTTTVVS
jgi:hypothetical protein